MFSLEDADTNFPSLFIRHFIGQGKEIARQCVEPPLKKKTQAPFTPSPSLKVVTSFLIKYVIPLIFTVYRYYYSYLVLNCII